jgi:hypothetical protein
MNPYTIAQGDTLSGIAAKNGLGIHDILSLNPHITDPNKIYAGTTLNLPSAKASTILPASPTAPPAPAGPNYSATANAAGAAGLPEKDYAATLSATPEEQKAAQDQIAKEFGYADSSAFFQDVFQKPSKSTEQFYQEAYNAAGLDKLTSDISSKKDALNRALGTVNDNPWYDEAFRRGEASRLQTLANGDITNLENQYNLKLGSVHDLVSRHADDMTANDKINQTRLAYLQKAAESAAAAAASARASQYLPDYLKGKQSTEKPQTVTIPKTGTVVAHDPVTNTWKTIGTGTAAGAASATATAKSKASTTAQKTIDQFNTDLSKLNPKTDTREALLTRLTAKYGSKIDPNDIARKVYDTYPDGYESRYKK